VKILLVDDEPVILEVLKNILENLGYKVVLANDADKATDILSSDAFDIVITDYNLPTEHSTKCFNGAELTTFIKEVSPATSVILISGTIDSELEEIAREAGADRLLEKPFPMDDLKEAIASLEKRDLQPQPNLKECVCS
jgi:CheY-like chemotaxis protein